MHIFRKMPVILVVLLIAIITCSKYIPLPAQGVLYAISLTIKSLIVFLLPFIVFGLLFKSAVSLARSATKVIFLVLVCIWGSNFIATFVTQYLGKFVYNLDLTVVLPASVPGLDPSWTYELPKFISNDKAMIAGVILGIIASFVSPRIAERTALALDLTVLSILNFFIYLVPFFIIGFAVKVQHDGLINIILKDYAVIFGVVALSQFVYILFMYWIGNNFNFWKMLKSLRNMLPSAIAGFSSQSSLMAMPLTIIGAEKNATDKDLVRSIIPATVNVHLIGDCFAIPIFAYAILKNFNMPAPVFWGYLLFAIYFVRSKFMVVAIPAGGIIVMLPILESYLGFNPEMLSLITALYVLFDPVITTANILANGAFALIIDKVEYYLRAKTSNQKRYFVPTKEEDRNQHVEPTKRG